MPGPVANSATVKAYELLKRADGPLTVRELAEQFPTTGFGSASMRAYREWADEHDESTSALLAQIGDAWPKATRQTAMEWWIYHRVLKVGSKTLTRSFHFRSATGRGAGRNFDYRDSLWLPDRPPKVRIKVWVEQATTVDWTPELEADLKQGAAAGIEYLAKLDEHRAKRGRRTKTDDLLDLAERAIRARQTR